MDLGVGVCRFTQDSQIAAIAKFHKGSGRHVADFQGVVEVVHRFEQGGNGFMFSRLPEPESGRDAIVGRCRQMGKRHSGIFQAVHSFRRIRGQRVQERFVRVLALKSAERFE